MVTRKSDVIFWKVDFSLSVFDSTYYNAYSHLFLHCHNYSSVSGLLFIKCYSSMIDRYWETWGVTTFESWECVFTPHDIQTAPWQTFLWWTFSQQAVPPSHFLNKQFSNWQFPKRTVPRKNISPNRHFPDMTFPPTRISFQERKWLIWIKSSKGSFYIVPGQIFES